jgi:hypothetical protein
MVPVAGVQLPRVVERGVERWRASNPLRAERRSVVYEMFAELLANELMER